jgi:hypothetical protein
VIGTVVGTLGMAGLQAYLVRRDTHGLEGPKMIAAVARMSAAAALLGAVSYGVWWIADDVLGRALWAQAVSVGAGVLAGSIVYAAAVWVLRVPEAKQIVDLLGGRFRRGRS